MFFTTRIKQLTGLICLSLFLTISMASAADSKKLVQQAKSQLRKVDSYMGNGDYTDAKIWLMDAAETIKELETVDPDSYQIQTLKSRVNGMVNGIKSNTGEQLDIWGQGTPAITQNGSTTANKVQEDSSQSTTISSGSKKLPYAVRQEMEELTTQFRNIDSSYNFLDPNDVTSTNTSQFLEYIPGLIAGLQPLLDQAQETAAKEGVTAHADFDAAQARIDEQPARFEQTRNRILAQREGEEAGKILIQADASQLKAEYQRLYSKYFSQAKGAAIYANDLPPIEQLLGLIEDFENNEKAPAEALLDDFAGKYGSTKSEIDQAAKTAKLNQDIQLGYAYTEFRNGVSNVTDTRQAEYDEMIKRITSMAGSISSLGDFYRLQGHDDARDWMALATKFAPDKDDANTMSGFLEKILNDDKTAFLGEIESVTWPGSTDDDNSEAALKYFRESDNWGKDPKGALTPIAIRVEGNWSVQKRDRLNSPTQYGIPAQVVVQMDSDKANGLARVFNVTMYAQESPSPRQGPPFVSISVGNSWYIFADRVE